MRYSLTDVCRLTGISPHVVRLCMRHRSITPERQAHNRRKYDLSSADVESIREAARELWPDDGASPHAGGAPDLSAVMGRLDALDRRVRALEARQHVAALPPLPREPRPPREPSYVRASLDTETGEVFPLAVRARARWVAARGGPPFATVRDWQATRDWQSAADAIAYVRDKAGYSDFMRSADTPPEGGTE